MTTTEARALHQDDLVIDLRDAAPAPAAPVADIELIVPDRVPVFGVGVDPVQTEDVVPRLRAAMLHNEPFTIACLATHGLVVGTEDPGFREALSTFDVVACDGQPVRWAVELLHDVEVGGTLSGLMVTLAACEQAAELGLGIYLFGSTRTTLDFMSTELRQRFPELRIVGAQPDRFRPATPEEDAEDIARINASGASVLFVGRGCPRQELWVAEHRDSIDMPMIAVGAAFDYLAGILRLPPHWMKVSGLEWLFRLAQEPRRLFRRYVETNSRFMVLLTGAVVRRKLGRSAPYDLSA